MKKTDEGKEFPVGPACFFGRLTEFAAHFVGGFKAEGFVERPARRAGMERDDAKALGAGPLEHGFEEPPGDAAAAGWRLSVHIQDPGALRKGFAGKARPVRQNDSAPGKDSAVGVFGEPSLVGAVAECLREIGFRGFIDAVECAGIGVAHILEHGSAMVDKMVEIGEAGFAEAEFHGSILRIEEQMC